MGLIELNGLLSCGAMAIFWGRGMPFTRLYSVCEVKLVRAISNDLFTKVTSNDLLLSLITYIREPSARAVFSNLLLRAICNDLCRYEGHF